MTEKEERTLILIKPESVQRGLVGEIIKRLENKGLKLVGLKMVWATQERMEQHYANLTARPFFAALVEHMSSSPLIASVWEGFNAVRIGRHMIGPAEPEIALPGTIRGDFCINAARSVIHGSHTVESANKEIALWFNEKELMAWTPNVTDWL